MKGNVKIGIIGDFDEKKPSHIATNEALRHCAEHLSIKADIIWLPTQSLEGTIEKDLYDFDAFWCSPGSPYRSYLGAIHAIQFAREENYPFIGTCGGFQHAAMEYAQNVLHINEIHHPEYNPDSSSFFITALSCSLIGQTRKIYLKKGSMLHAIYGEDETTERYNCSFGLNAVFQTQLEQNGFVVVGTDDQKEARAFELPENDFYIATLFQPQLSSTPIKPHKLILQFLTAAKNHHDHLLIKKAE